MTRALLGVGALALVLAAPLAGATDYCDAGYHEIAPGVYLAFNGWFCHSTDCGITFTYLYLETNGREGLQRGDTSLLRGDYYCLGFTDDPDTLVV